MFLQSTNQALIRHLRETFKMINMPSELWSKIFFLQLQGSVAEGMIFLACKHLQHHKQGDILDSRHRLKFLQN